MSVWLMIAAAAQPAAVETAAPAEQGVIAYPPSFFAAASPTNAYDMVIRVPGFTFDKGTAIRGLAGSGGNVLVDGAPQVAKNDALDEILKRIPAASVERIDLIRGSAPGIDMGNRTVVVNVVRKQTAGFRGAFMPGAYFVYDGRVLTGIRAEGQWRWPGGRSAELAQVYGKGPNEELGDGVRTTTFYSLGVPVRVRLSDVDADSAGTRIWTTGAYETPLAGGRVRLNGAYMLTPSRTEIYDRYREGGREYEYDDIDKLQAELGARYTRNLLPGLSVEAVGFQQWIDQDTKVHFEAPTVTRDFHLARDSTESVARADFRWSARPSVMIEFGGEAALNKLDSATRLLVNGVGRPVPAANVHVEETRGEAFVKGAWRPTSKLTVEGGVRQEGSTVTAEGDVNSETSLQYTKPRLAITWAPNADTQIRGRIEREVGQLNFDDFVASPNVASTGQVVAGNPNLRPEQAWVFEVAAERRFWQGAAAVLTLRHYDLSDVVDRMPVRNALGIVVADAPGNIGEGTKDEVQASLTLPLDRFGVKRAQLKGALTWRSSEVVDPLTGETREISGLHPIDWEAHFSQDLPAWKLVWGVDAVGAFRERWYRFSEIETRKISTWVVVFTEYKPRPDWILRVEAVGATLRNAKRIREVYVGRRDNPLLHDFDDIRDLEWGGHLNVRLRKLL